MDIDEVLRSASLEEKLSLLVGHDFWHTTPVSRFSIPSIRVTDGPNGVRGPKFFNGVPSACLPCGTGLGATWNTELLRRAGGLISDECAAKGAAAWLGPTVNIQRSPLGGRGFESFSEDPVLSGILAGSYIQGAQGGGTCAVLKHFVCNDMEEERMSIDVRISERALREIYLLPFQIAIRDAKPAGIMTAYNKVNGTHCSENSELLERILRQEWEFKGMVMSDWYGTYSLTDSLVAGLDLEMPGRGRFRIPSGTASITSGKLKQRIIDKRVRTVLEFVQRACKKKLAQNCEWRNTIEDRALNRELAIESIVLLKNERGILPLSNDGGDIAIIGPNAKMAAICGGGSASLQAYYSVTPFEAIQKQAVPGTTLHYEIGAYGHKMQPLFDEKLITCAPGRPGALMRFYNEPYTISTRQSCDEIITPNTNVQLMDYVNPALGMTYYATLTASFVPEASGVYDFGLAVFGTANLYINDELVIDNSTTQRHGGLFFGKGTIEEMGSFEMFGGQQYELRVEFGNATTSKLTEAYSSSFAGGALRLGGCLRIDPEDCIRRAVKVAKKCQHTILVAGLNGDWETEGQDRQSMDAPLQITKLISAVLDAQPNAIIVTQSGTPFTMPWISSASTVLHSWFGGSEVGTAIASVIFGLANPSGKLPLTFPKQLKDTPAYTCFGSDAGTVVYGEDYFVGYRWYEMRGIEVAFPFGHGLSYTTFALEDFRVTESAATVTMRNMGKLPGAEVIMFYISRLSTSSLKIQRPQRELKGFEKVYLERGAEKRVQIPINKYTTASWDRRAESWVNEEGIWKVSLIAGAEQVNGELVLKGSTWWNGL